MPKVQNKKKVFLSYAQADSSKLDLILKNLIADGVIEEEDRILSAPALKAMRTTIRDPKKHGAIREDVKKQIQSASKVVVVWSPASAGSQWVNYELGLADALGKQIIAVVRGDDTVALPQNLANIHVVKVASNG